MLSSAEYERTIKVISLEIRVNQMELSALKKSGSRLQKHNRRERKKHNAYANGELPIVDRTTSKTGAHGNQQLLLPRSPQIRSMPNGAHNGVSLQISQCSDRVELFFVLFFGCCFFFTHFLPPHVKHKNVANMIG